MTFVLRTHWYRKSHAVPQCNRREQTIFWLRVRTFASICIPSRLQFLNAQRYMKQSQVSCRGSNVMSCPWEFLKRASSFVAPGDLCWFQLLIKSLMNLLFCSNFDQRIRTCTIVLRVYVQRGTKVRFLLSKLPPRTIRRSPSDSEKEKRKERDNWWEYGRMS